MAFAFFQSSGNSLSHYDLWKIIQSGLTMTSDSSLSISGCILLGPTDLFMSILFKCTLSWSSTNSKVFFLLTFPNGLRDLAFLKANFTSKGARHVRYWVPQSSPCPLLQNTTGSYSIQPSQGKEVCSLLFLFNSSTKYDFSKPDCLTCWKSWHNKEKQS